MVVTFNLLRYRNKLSLVAPAFFATLRPRVLSLIECSVQDQIVSHRSSYERDKVCEFSRDIFRKSHVSSLSMLNSSSQLPINTKTTSYLSGWWHPGECAPWRFYLILLNIHALNSSLKGDSGNLLYGISSLPSILIR
jgi:hypothetical protein